MYVNKTMSKLEHPIRVSSSIVVVLATHSFNLMFVIMKINGDSVETRKLNENISKNLVSNKPPHPQSGAFLNP